MESSLSVIQARPVLQHRLGHLFFRPGPSGSDKACFVFNLLPVSLYASGTYVLLDDLSIWYYTTYDTK